MGGAVLPAVVAVAAWAGWAADVARGLFLGDCEAGAVALVALGPSD